MRRGAVVPLRALRASLRTAMSQAGYPERHEECLLRRLRTVTESVDGFVDFLRRLSALTDTSDTGAVEESLSWQPRRLGSNSVLGVFVRQVLLSVLEVEEVGLGEVFVLEHILQIHKIINLLLLYV